MHLVNRAPRPLAVVAIVAILASCGSSAPAATSSAAPSPTVLATARPTPTPTPTIRPTRSPSNQPVSGRIEVTTAGYAITLPDNWFRVELDSAGVTAMIDAGAGEFTPEMEEFIHSQAGSMAASGVSMFAFRIADDAAAAGTTANVLSMSTFGMSLDTLETLNKAQLKSILGKDLVIAATRVDLPVGEALRLAYELPLRTSPITVSAIQYLVVVDGKQFIMSCTTPSDPAGIADECETMARSLEMLG